jgi:hypothetical protein
MNITLHPRAALLSTLLVLAGAMPWHGAVAADRATRAGAALQALDSAMNPGPGQKRLDPMIGTFDVTVLVWTDPAKPPLEYQGSAVNTWALGGRYVQTMLSTVMDGEAFDGIGYYGFDNSTNTYQAAWMDNGSTAIGWYQGKMDKAGRAAVLKSSVVPAVGGRPVAVEMHVSIAESGDHVTQLWGAPRGGKAFKFMELRSVRAKK